MTLDRRALMRGTLNGAAVFIGLPLLDLFLDGNGEALAATGARPAPRFGTWFWGQGCTPNRWFPNKRGAGYDLKVELAGIAPLQHKINIFSDFNCPLDGAPNLVHKSGPIGIRTGMAARADVWLPAPSFDVLIGDQIGTKTRFRSLELSATGDPRNSLSGRGEGSLNPSEISPVAFYQRLFGTGFRDPNKADFAPDPAIMTRRSVLSAVSEDRKRLDAQVGAADRRRLDQYYTSVRQLENQLDVELSPPTANPWCAVPAKRSEEPTDAVIDHVIKNHQLMTDLLVMALTCDQTRVFNLHFNDTISSLTKMGTTTTHHQLTHEELIDPKLGYQPQATWFLEQSMLAWVYFIKALDAVKEGDRTLLDNTLVFAHSETEFAKFHTIDNIPMMTAGSGGGRIRTGLHVAGQGTPVSRLGLTMQQVMGVSVDKWGTGSLETRSPVSEIVA